MMEALDPFVLGETLFVFYPAYQTSSRVYYYYYYFFITRQRPEPSGVLRISSDWDDLMGQKSKRENIPRASNKSPKFPWNKN